LPTQSNSTHPALHHQKQHRHHHHHHQVGCSCRRCLVAPQGQSSMAPIAGCCLGWGEHLHPLPQRTRLGSWTSAADFVRVWRQVYHTHSGNTPHCSSSSSNPAFMKLHAHSHYRLPSHHPVQYAYCKIPDMLCYAWQMDYRRVRALLESGEPKRRKAAACRCPGT
jgi:hypothetical protein